MIKGIPFELGDRTLVVPPLSLGTLEAMEEQLGAFRGDASDAKQISTALDCVTAALKRNYPDITREQVADMVDLANMSEVMQAVMDASGVRRKALEASAAGEAQALSNGAASTQG